nr:hypothetical protein [Tanacetum cinerariifolium]
MDQGLAQIESEADLAQKIYEEELAELDRAQKERQKQEKATIAALTEEFDEIQARMDVDHELVVRMTHEEQEMYTIKEMARLLAEYFERRKKQLAAEKAEAIRNKPPTRTQVRNMMITYLKHMGKYTHQQLKHKTLEELQMLYERDKRWIDDFVLIDSKKEEKKPVEPESKDKKGKTIKRVTARMDVDHELVVRMTHEEQEMYTIEEMARLLAEYFERRKKQLAAEKAEAIRNKPPTRTQVRNMMITYLKHMGKYTHQQLKHKTLEELQMLYERDKRWIDDFVLIDSKKEEKKPVEPESKDKKGKTIKRVTGSAPK